MKGKPTAARWVREVIQQQCSYHVPAAGDYIKLDAMENPWPMPAAINQLWRESLAALQLNRYPDPQAGEVVQRLRVVMGIPDAVTVIPGNGSDELIQVIMMALAGENRVVLAPSPSFVMYEVLARACGLSYVDVPLQLDFRLDMPAMKEAIARHQPAVIFLASPNNPTGVAYKESEIEEILQCAPGLVVIDEAYQPFTSEAGGNFMARLVDYPDLIVMRTLSKVGLAGIRLGLIAGHADWLTEVDKLRLPYNINTLTQATAAFALDHWSVFEQQIEKICVQRERVYQALSAMAGVHAWPSETNFILFRLSEKQAEEVHAGLLKQGILIKCLHRPGSALDNCLRVTIGRADENDAFLSALARLLETIERLHGALGNLNRLPPHCLELKPLAGGLEHAERGSTKRFLQDLLFPRHVLPRALPRALLHVRFLLHVPLRALLHVRFLLHVPLRVRFLQYHPCRHPYSKKSWFH